MKRIISLITAFVILCSYSCFCEEVNNEDVAETTEKLENTTQEIENKPELPNGKIIWVKSDFKGGDGSFEAPYSSITQAQSAVNKLSNEEKQQGVTVMLREGEYTLTSSLEFTSGNSGISAEAPIVYSAYNGEKVVFKGTKTISKSKGKLVTDSAIKDRLNKNAKNKVYEYDLKDCGINDLGKNYYVPIGGNATDQNVSIGTNTNTVMLFYNGISMTNSEYPNSGELYVEEAANVEGDFCVVTADARDKAHMSNWKNLSDATFHYYTKQGYEYFIVPFDNGKVDATAVKYYLPYDKIPKGAQRYMPNKMARYKIVNLIEEIDVAGEWAIDYTNRKLYFYAPSETLGDIELAMLNKPVLNIDGASNITFKGITFGYARNNGVSITNSTNIVLDGCEVTGLGADGIEIMKSTNITVKNCKISDIFESGIRLENNGNRVGYKSSGIMIECNDVFDTAKVHMTTGAIELKDTINAKIINNRVHNCTFIGINLETNGNIGTVIENNEAYDTTRRGLDASAIYCPTMANWGTSISNNYVHDIIRYTKQQSPVSGIYLDADGTGLKVRNNIVQNISSYGFHFNGGDCNVLENNIVISAGTPIFYSSNLTAGFDSSSTDSILEYFYGPSKEYLAIFPELGKLIQDKGKGKEVYALPKYNTLRNNISMLCGSNPLIYGHVSEFGEVIENNTRYTDMSWVDFKDIDNYDLSFTENSKVFEEIPDFKVIDFNSMGLKENIEVEAPTLVAPYNGEENVDISNSVLKWKGNYHNKYRLIVARDANFDAKVLDEIVVGNTYAPTTLKYGNRTYYWKVIPVKESKSDIITEKESEVFTFRTLDEQELDKAELRSLLKQIGKDYAEFEGYSTEAVENMKVAYNYATDVNNSATAKQVNVLLATEKLKKALSELYSSVSTNEIKINDFVADTDNWLAPEGTILDGKQVTFPVNAPTRFAIYKGHKFKSGDMLHFKGIFNYTNWQMFGFQTSSTNRFSSDISYVTIVRDGGYEIQRYNYDETGKLTGGIIANYPNYYTTAGEEMDIKMGFMEVHNGTRFVMEVNGRTVFDHVDTTDLAITDNMYFGMHDGSFQSMSVMAVEE